ncbi:MAG: hypothetical protein RLZZ453_131 [Chlamydiota bacterium]|jgi:isopentenyl-diphosphate delta-isomerase
MEERVILVDTEDRPLGTKEKLTAHVDGDLHRAFSIFLFNSKGHFLLQKRALAKYHSPGKWTNTCCSHPRLHESLEEAALRRLKEEMGIACELNKVFSFIYKEDVGGGLIEHEFDHVFFGLWDKDPIPNPDEVCDFRFVDFETLQQEIAADSSQYTVWFLKIFERVLEYLPSLPLGVRA